MYAFAQTPIPHSLSTPRAGLPPLLLHDGGRRQPGILREVGSSRPGETPRSRGQRGRARVA
eukprot:47425-Eustigmatos_ZCMA.PRE.1